jgi:DNA primase
VGAAFSQKDLTCSASALQYLKSRHVSFRQVQQYRIGYISRFTALEGLDKTLFPDNLLFPMLNEFQEPVGVVTRSLKEGYGYSKHVFDKEGASKRFLFGLEQALPHIYKHGTVLCVEGIFDLLAVEPYFPASIAMLTSRLSREQQDVLFRYVDRILFMGDSDRAGREAAQHATKYVSKRFSVSVIPVQTKDPSGWRSQHPDAFKEKMLYLKEIYLS